MGSENQWEQIGPFLPHWLVLSIKPYLLVHGCSLHLLSNPSFASLAHLQVSAILLIAIACYWLTVTQALSPCYRDCAWNLHMKPSMRLASLGLGLKSYIISQLLGNGDFPCPHTSKGAGICFGLLDFNNLITTVITAVL